MRVINLSPQQAQNLSAQIARAISSYLDEGVWDLEFELPDCCVERPTVDLDLSKPRAVIYDGDREASLSDRQYALLKFLVDAGGASKLAAVAQAVWSDPLVSQAAIRKVAERVNLALLDSDIPFALKVTARSVSLSNVGRI